VDGFVGVAVGRRQVYVECGLIGEKRVDKLQ
jgi:hypothetical protein